MTYFPNNLLNTTFLSVFVTNNRSCCRESQRNCPELLYCKPNKIIDMNIDEIRHLQKLHCKYSESPGEVVNIDDVI